MKTPLPIKSTWIDLHIHSNLSVGENTVEEIVENAKKLGFSNIALADVTKDNIKKAGELQKEIKIKRKVLNYRIHLAADLFENSLKEAKREVVRVRRHVDYISLSTENLTVARWAAKSPLIDGLAITSTKREVMVDKITSRFMLEGDTSYEVKTSFLGYLRARRKATVLRRLMLEMKIVKHYGNKIIFSSDAKNLIEMKTPLQFMSTAVLLGLDYNYAKKTVSLFPAEIISKNSKKKSG